MRRPSLGAIFLTLFLDVLGFGLVLPFLAKSARDTFGTPEAVGTLLGSVYALMQFLFIPVWGRLSDRVGRRPVLVWSVAATVLSMAGLGVGLAWGATVAWLFVARTFGGIATANIGTATAYIADITKPEERSRGMGIVGIAFGTGFILGPALGGVLAQYPVNGHKGVVPCFVAAGLSVINLVWVAFGLTESLPPERRTQVKTRRLSPLDIASMRRAFSLPGVGRAIAANFIAILAFTTLDQTFTFFNHDEFGLDERGTGIFLGSIGVASAIVQGGVLRPLSRKYSDAQILRAGIAIQVLAFVALVLSPSFGRSLLFAAGGLLAVGNGLSQPTFSAYISKSAPAEEQGATLGTSQSFASLARTFGPVVGGSLYGAVHHRAPYAAAACGMMLALLFALGLATQKTSTQTS